MIESQKELRLTLLADSADLSPTEFVSLFQCGEELIRAVAEDEALALLEAVGLDSRARLATVQRLHRLGRGVQIPAIVDRVEPGSWLVVIGLAGPALLFFLKEYIHPVVHEAWEESEMRSRLSTFLRERVFTRAQQTVESSAIQRPDWGNLKVSSVDDAKVFQGPVSEETRITIRLERREIVEFSLSDEELLKEFLRRLRRG